MPRLIIRVCDWSYWKGRDGVLGTGNTSFMVTQNRLQQIFARIFLLKILQVSVAITNLIPKPFSESWSTPRFLEDSRVVPS